jgi:uncharacterized membrane protein YidH (DUF202 family)
MKAIGVLLIVLGIVGLAYGGLTWKTREKVVDVGPVEVTQNKTHSLPFSPIAGGVCLIAGVIVLVGSNRRS